MSLLTMPKIGSVQSDFDETVQIMDVSRAYFSDPAVSKQVDDKIDAVYAWLLSNKQSYTPLGDLREKKPWWPTPAAIDIDDLQLAEALLETRRRILRDKVFGYGLMRLLRGLEDEEVIGELTDATLDVVNGAMTQVIVSQLVSKKIAPKHCGTVSLNKLSELYGNGVNTKPTKIRNRLLARLCPVGLINARFNMGYEISIGPVAYAFYTKVFVPLVNEMEPGLKG